MTKQNYDLRTYYHLEVYNYTILQAFSIDYILCKTNIIIIIIEFIESFIINNFIFMRCY